jgi:hypothetical protein
MVVVHIRFTQKCLIPLGFSFTCKNAFALSLPTSLSIICLSRCFLSPRVKKMSLCLLWSILYLSPSLSSFIISYAHLHIYIVCHLSIPSNMSFFSHIILVFLSQHSLCNRIVCTNPCSLPSSIISTRVTHAKLKPIILISSYKQKGDIERAEALRIACILAWYHKGIEPIVQQVWALGTQRCTYVPELVRIQALRKPMTTLLLQFFDIH